MSTQPVPDVVLSFPELSHSEAVVIAQELEQLLLREGLSRDEVAIARSDKEAMDLGGVVLLFGTILAHEAAHKLAAHAVGWLIEKTKVFIVAKSASGQSWSYGEQYRKGIQSVVRNPASTGFGTLGVILLGASQYPGMQGLDNPSFARSAGLIRQTLTPEYSLFRATRELNLFDSPLLPLDIIEKIEEFIDNNPDINDFLFYYCGHGSYLRDSGRSYFLTLKATKAGKEAFTGLKLQDFRQSLELRLVNKRFYLVLDACFSGEAAREFMSVDAQDFVRNQIADALPASGWAVITASPRTMVAMAPEGCDYTMFTGAFADALRHGSPLLRTHFSLSDLTEETRRRIIQTYGPARAVAPQCIAAVQSEGDLTRAALFVNKAFDDAPAPAMPADMELFETIVREFDSPFAATRKAAMENAYKLWMKTNRPDVKERAQAFFAAALEDDSVTIRNLAAQYKPLVQPAKTAEAESKPVPEVWQAPRAVAAQKVELAPKESASPEKIAGTRLNVTELSRAETSVREVAKEPEKKKKQPLLRLFILIAFFTVVGLAGKGPLFDRNYLVGSAFLIIVIWVVRQLRK